MSWIDKQSNETAANLKTRLTSLGAYVPLSRTPSASTLAYSANGLVLRQVQSTTVGEYRALTQAAAELLATLSSDGTESTIYYHGIGSYTGSGNNRVYSEYVACGVTTGTKVDYTASRVNESDEWKVVCTETVYAAGATTGWSTTRPTAATTTGIVTGQSSSSSYLYAYNSNHVYATEVSTTTEYRFLTKSEAETKVSQNNSNNTKMWKWRYGTGTFRVYTWKGTIKSAVSRYVDGENGYTVTVTEKTLSASGTNWNDEGAA